jgi:hypothetical protein
MTQASAKLQTCYRQKCPIRSEDIQFNDVFSGIDFYLVDIDILKEWLAVPGNSILPHVKTIHLFFSAIEVSCS